MLRETVIEGIKAAAQRSAWVRVLSAKHEDNDSIIRDAELIRLVWSEKDVEILESYFIKQNQLMKDEAHVAMDRGVISFNELIDIFMTEKNNTLRKLQETAYE